MRALETGQILMRFFTNLLKPLNKYGDHRSKEAGERGLPAVRK